MNSVTTLMNGAAAPEQYAFDAEQRVLGSLMLDNAVMHLAQPLTADAFADPRHPVVFEAISSLIAQRKVADPVTVHAHLEIHGHHGKVDLSYLNGLTQSVPNPKHVDHYAGLVRNASAVRVVERTRGEAIEILRTERDLPTAAAQAAELIARLGQRSAGSPWSGAPLSLLGAKALDERLGPEPFVIDGLLPVDAVGLVGTGGTGKSTFLLWLLVHVALGMPILGAAMVRSGPVLYVSGEDRRETIVRRLQEVVGEHGMSLSRAEQEHVFERFRVEDVSGLPVRLVSDAFGVLSETAALEQFIHEYRDAGIVVVVIDPVSLLGAGERSGNDGAAEMMRAARRISMELNCCCILVHHESKAGAREQVTDQYAGRGGAAFADNSRGLLQLVTAQALTVEYAHQKWAAPCHWSQDDVDSGSILVLYLHKLTAKRRDRRPIFIRRNAWSYEVVHGLLVDSAEALKAEFEGLRRAVVALVSDGLKSEVKRAYSPTSLAAACNTRRIASRSKLRDAVKDLIEDGTLLELSIPEASKLRQGSLKTYLVPASEVQLAL